MIPQTVSTFDDRIARLDLGLFQYVPSQTSANDRRSLLSIHSAVRSRPFVYLEIGSHLGGSLQALLADPQCQRVITIDARPSSQPDERGEAYEYPNNSTVRMLAGLKNVPGGDLSKITAFDAGTESLRPSSIPDRPKFCFIDGEHTDTAALRDAQFCLKLVQEDGCLVFHDACIVYRALDQFTRELAEAGRAFRAYVLPDCVFVVELGECYLSRSPQISPFLINSFQSYLWGLLANDGFRQAFHELRKVKEANAQLTEEVRNLRACLGAVTASRSWRITAPLRRWAGLIRGGSRPTVPESAAPTHR